MIQVEGRCHCGKISFRATVDPEKASLCHCTDCQVLTGTAYRVSVPAAREHYELLSGQPKVYVKTADSGWKRVQAFCGDCGTPLYASDVGEAPVYNLRVGCLRQRGLLAPRRRIWCRSALPWSEDIRAVPGSQTDE